MATMEKYRINSLSKDLGVKNKVLVQLLADHGMPGKSSMSVLEEPELSLIFEYVTQSNPTDITAFFNYYDAKKKAAAKDKEKEEEKKQAENTADTAKQAQKSKAPEKKGNAPVKKKDPSKVRHVDTRGGVAVDLSKYDGKLDKYDTASDKDTKSVQRIKKKNQQRQQQDNFKGGKNAQQKKTPFKPKPVKLVINVPEEITVGELASRMKTAVAEVIKRLMKMGVMATVNETVDFDTAYLLCDEMGITVNKEVVVTIEEKLFDESEDTAEQLVHRPPVVVIMGHVDHGKTSLLDAIRHTNVTSGEAGGITQHIGAYSVTINDEDITFLDTPGHAAFTAMRARGANITDIAVLVVAADDGIMPQTVEAINHAKAAGVSIIVAINKMDKPDANPDAVKNALVQYDLVPEEWGGDVICVPVSALKKQGINDLLEMILLNAEVMDLRANPNRSAKGVVVEARLDKGRGAVATILVQNGTLKSGDIVIAGTSVGRVRVMLNDKGQRITEAGPSCPVEITGLSEAPEAGDILYAVKDEKMARELVEKRKNEKKEEEFKRNNKASLEDLFSQINEGTKELNLIVKADVQGSAEAVKASLEKLTNEEVKVRVIHAGVGAISDNDIMLADASNAIIIGFNIRPDKAVLQSADEKKVQIKSYRIIYECLEEIEAAMKGMLAPKFKEVILGRAEVRQTIHVPNIGTIAGSYVLDGKITRNAQIRVVRDSVVIFEDKISSLRRFKDDVKEVAQSFECGIGLEKFNDIKLGDVLEAFIMEEVKQ